MDVYCEIDWPGDSAVQAFSHPAEVLIAHWWDEVGGVIDRAEACAADGSWVVGWLAYEAAAALDPALAAREPRDGFPLAAFAVFRSPAPARARGEFMAGRWQNDLSPAEFDAGVTSIRSDIANGRFYQVNYTTRLRASFLGDAAALFDALRAAQPAAHSVFLDIGRWQVCSVSPELFFHWQRGATGVPRRLTLRPMKGTAQRQTDPGADGCAAQNLRDSAKDRAENLMIVDLLRNDASRIARLGSVGVPRLFDVEPWATVWQMTSTVECETRQGVGLADVFTALFPCGSVTGAPKVEAMKAIRELESEPRGVYCGALGVLLPGGEARFNVGIRTVIVDNERRVAECGIGSGIVIDSTIAGEAEEWRMKQRFLRRACPEYELLETLLWRRGRYWLRKEHLARLAESARALGFVWNGQAVERALDEASRAFGPGRWRVRVRLAMDGSPTVEGAPLAQTERHVSFAIAQEPVDSANPWLRHKTTRRAFYEALEVPGAFDTLLHNERGEATEFTRGNLVVKLGGRLLTPALECGLLPGAFRASLLARGAIEEAVIRIDDLGRAEAIWFVNSVRGALRARLE